MKTKKKALLISGAVVLVAACAAVQRYMLCFSVLVTRSVKRCMFT